MDEKTESAIARVVDLHHDLDCLIGALKDARDESAWLRQIAGALFKHTAPGLAHAEARGLGAPRLWHPNGHVNGVLDGRYVRPAWLPKLAKAAGLEEKKR